MRTPLTPPSASLGEAVGRLFGAVLKLLAAFLDLVVSLLAHPLTMIYIGLRFIGAFFVIGIAVVTTMFIIDSKGTYTTLALVVGAIAGLWYATKPLRQKGPARQPALYREPIPDRVKMFVWQRDGGGCVSCGSRQRLEFDHIIPLSMGGSNTARNLQLLCETCNRSKGGRLT